MRWLLLELTIVIFYFIIMHNFVKTEVNQSPQQILNYEYGSHVPGEKRSFWYVGKIPAITSLFNLNVTPTAEGLEKRYTYLRVEYVNSVSNVLINYDPHTHILSFTVVFPIMETPIGVVGYSVPLKVEDNYS